MLALELSEKNVHDTLFNVYCVETTNPLEEGGMLFKLVLDILALVEDSKPLVEELSYLHCIFEINSGSNTL